MGNTESKIRLRFAPILAISLVFLASGRVMPAQGLAPAQSSSAESTGEWISRGIGLPTHFHAVKGATCDERIQAGMHGSPESFEDYFDGCYLIGQGMRMAKKHPGRAAGHVLLNGLGAVVAVPFQLLFAPSSLKGSAKSARDDIRSSYEGELSLGYANLLVEICWVNGQIDKLSSFYSYLSPERKSAFKKLEELELANKPIPEELNRELLDFDNPKCTAKGFALFLNKDEITRRATEVMKSPSPDLSVLMHQRFEFGEGDQAHFSLPVQLWTDRWSEAVSRRNFKVAVQLCRSTPFFWTNGQIPKDQSENASSWSGMPGFPFRWQQAGGKAEPWMPEHAKAILGALLAGGAATLVANGVEAAAEGPVDWYASLQLRLGDLDWSGDFQEPEKLEALAVKLDGITKTCAALSAFLKDSGGLVSVAEYAGKPVDGLAQRVEGLKQEANSRAGLLRQRASWLRDRIEASSWKGTYVKTVEDTLPKIAKDLFRGRTASAKKAKNELLQEASRFQRFPGLVGSIRHEVQENWEAGAGRAIRRDEGIPKELKARVLSAVNAFLNGLTPVPGATDTNRPLFDAPFPVL